MNKPIQATAGVQLPATKHTLCFACSSAISAVEELLQSARRAGASFVSVQYDRDARVLSVRHDGTVVLDFAALLSKRVIPVGEESPYGARFVAAVTRAESATILAGGKAYNFVTAELQAKQKAALQVRATKVDASTVLLKGFQWDDPLYEIEGLVAGFPIPVFFNSEEVARPFALDASAVAGEHGMYMLGAQEFNRHAMRLYIDGICVCGHLYGFLNRKVARHITVPVNVIHVNSRANALALAGAFEDGLHGAARDEMQRLYEERLMEMKQALSPLQFCREGYALAASLDRLDIFNDVCEVPAEWVGRILELPTAEGNIDDMVAQLPVSNTPAQFADSIPRQSIEDGQFVVAHLTAFKAWEDGLGNQLACMLAYASQALCILQRLHPDHWLMRHARINDASNVQLKVEGTGRTGGASLRAHRIDGHKVVLVEAAKLSCDMVSAQVREPFYGMLEGELCVVVPKVEKGYPQASEKTVLQFAPYLEGEGFEHHDGREVNRVVQRLIANNPADRITQVLADALRDDADLRGKSFRVTIDENGWPVVKAIEPELVPMSSR